MGRMKAVQISKRRADWEIEEREIYERMISGKASFRAVLSMV